MNRFLNVLIGCIAFACILILGKTGAVLTGRNARQTVEAQDYLFLGLVVASMFFLQYAIERYLIPPTVFAKEQRKGLLEAAETGYRKTFFRGAIGISYFLLILYVFEYLRPVHVAGDRTGNWIGYSVFFQILGLLARARGIILHFSEQARAANPPLDSSQPRAGGAPAGQ